MRGNWCPWPCPTTTSPGVAGGLPNQGCNIPMAGAPTLLGQSPFHRQTLDTLRAHGWPGRPLGQGGGGER
eukprot:1732687-Lingulodinium_polyedra.AAC.1